MKTDVIDEVGITPMGGLFVRPRESTFLHIYREDMEVQWNLEKTYLYAPPPRRWSYLRWYRQIITAANEQGVRLRLHADTSWTRIPAELKDGIRDFERRA